MEFRSIVGAVGMLVELVTRAEARDAGSLALEAGDLPMFTMTLPSIGHLCLHHIHPDDADPPSRGADLLPRTRGRRRPAREYLAGQLEVLGRCVGPGALHRLVMVERYGDGRPDRVIAEGTVRGGSAAQTSGES